MLMPLNIPPGVYRNGTDMQAASRWRDASLIRWHDNAMRPVGGWTQKGSNTITGIPRGALAWIDNSNEVRGAVGTHDALYAFTNADAWTAITPSGFTSGRATASQNIGYGGGDYGEEAFGTERTPSGPMLPATQWTLDNWGQDLIACSPDDGKIYDWTPGDAAAVVISNAPTSCRAAVVAEERFIFALGAGGDPRKVQWCDREANTTWTPAATNEAGDQILATTGQLLCGKRTRGQTLFLTTEDAHAATYIGPPFVFRIERVGTSCGAVSNNAAATVDNGVFWMGRRGFYRYAEGRVQQVECEVADYVFSRINRAQISKVCAVVNAQWSEIWWFYPAGTENDSYVSFNYITGVWSIGAMGRTAGVDRGAFNRPIWFDSDGKAYEHETGYSWGGAFPYAETGPMVLGDGDRRITVTRLHPDEQTQGEVTATFKTRNYPQGPETVTEAYTLSAPTGVRFSGRQFRLRVTGTVNDDWRWGVPRVDVQERGRR